MIFNSIRWRLQAWHGLILVVVLTGFGLTAFHVVSDSQFRRIDQDLDQRLMAVFRPRPHHEPPAGPGQPWPGPGEQRPPEERGLGRFPEPHDPQDMLTRVREMIQQAGSLEANPTNSCYYLLWQQGGVLAAQSANAPAGVPIPKGPDPSATNGPARLNTPGEPGPPQLGRFQRAEARTRGQFRELSRCGPLGDCILVGRSIAPDLAALHRLALWLAMAGAGVLLLGLAGGWWLATRAIRPIEDISATALKISAGELSQRINAADAESELGRLAGVLNSTFARLEASFAQQARFTADASHELRTPVAVILNQTQGALARERPGAEYREALEACQRAAQRMRKLTESLLELARLDAGQEPMKREPFDLFRVVRDSVDLVRPLAAEADVEIQCQISPVNCLGDAERIGQVVTNLLANAIQFNHPRGQVQVSAQVEEGSARLVVTDSGQGIPAEDLPNIFERFYRADKSRSRSQGRTGLGLAICKAIVDAHSGTIGVASQPGAGSTFTVKLPLR